MIIDLLNLLFETSLVLSLGLVFVLALRRVWRHLFGARNALMLWLVVPTLLAAVLWPAPIQRIDAAIEAASSPPTTIIPAARDAVARTLPGLNASASDDPDALVNAAGGADAARLGAVGWFVGWLVGVVLTALFLIISQWRWMRTLGALRRTQDGTYRSARPATGPVLIGALRPKIVLPAEFERGYTDEQQTLILAHERCHLRRGDAQFTLLACILRCVFWFNPLVHLAWPRFRMDMELACDAAVLRRYPQHRRVYAETLLTGQLDSPRLQVGCTWRSSSPLKQRIRMIGARPVSGLRMALGTGLIVAAGSVAAVGAWQQQEPQRFFFDTSMPKLVLDLAPAVLPVPPVQLPRVQTPTGFSMPQYAVSIHPPPLPESAVEAPGPAPAAGPSFDSVSTDSDRTGASADASHGVAVADDDLAPAVPEAVSETMAEVQHARLVEVQRPAFPESRYQPRLVSYPGMPESERPAADWQPEGRLWVLLMRVRLDESGRPVDVNVEDTNLEDGRSVDRYERLTKQAIGRWTFAPARIDGQPVVSEVLLPFYFDTRANARPIDFDRNAAPAMNRSVVTRYAVRR